MHTRWRHLVIKSEKNHLDKKYIRDSRDNQKYDRTFVLSVGALEKATSAKYMKSQTRPDCKKYAHVRLDVTLRTFRLRRANREKHRKNLKSD